MKKSILSSIILSAAVLGLGVQANHATTVHAEVSSTEGTTDTSAGQAEELNGKLELTKTENTDTQTSDSHEVPDATGDTPKKEPKVEQPSDDKKESQKVEEPEVEQPSDGKKESQKIEEPKVEQPSDDKEVVEKNESTIITIKPKTPNLANSVNPADEGPLLIPYKVYSNEIVYLDPETHQLIEDENDNWHTGYRLNGLDVVYGKEAKEIDAISGDYTTKVYTNGGEWSWQEPTTKVLKIRALVREAEYFLEFRNHGYSNLAELNDYMDKYEKLYNQFIAENDDGTTVVPVDDTKTTDVSRDDITTPTKSHSHRSSTTESTSSNTTDAVNLTVTTIRQASLYTENGSVVGNRGLTNDSTWKVQAVAVINGKTMYRVTANEWVADEDVK